MNIKLLNKLLLIASIFFCSCQISEKRSKLDMEQSNQWSIANGWLRGSIFIPNTAINQLEMLQSETFDTATFDCELSYAEGPV